MSSALADVLPFPLTLPPCDLESLCTTAMLDNAEEFKLTFSVLKYDRDGQPFVVDGERIIPASCVVRFVESLKGQHGSNLLRWSEEPLTRGE